MTREYKYSLTGKYKNIEESWERTGRTFFRA